LDDRPRSTTRRLRPQRSVVLSRGGSQAQGAYHPDVTDHADDAALERQRAAAEADFREGWLPIEDGSPRVLSAGYYELALRAISGGSSAGLDPAVVRAVRDGARPGDHLPPPELSRVEYNFALKVISDGLLTGMDPGTIRAVRDGAQPGDRLPPPERKPFIVGVSDDAEVIISGDDSDRHVAVLFSHQHFPGIRFGHRFPPPTKNEIRYSTISLKESIETGALGRMMRDPPSADEAGITWTIW
jgi:hypothetical protein